MLFHDTRFMWKRGKPVLQGDYITIENPKEYQPYECEDLLYDFSAVKDEKDVISFVRKYGLLLKPEGFEKTITFKGEASVIRLLFRIVQHIRNNQASVLWDIWSKTEVSSVFKAPPKDDKELLGQASALVATAINEHLENVPSGLIPEAALEVDGISGELGNFLWIAYPDNLLQFIYYQFAMALNIKKPLADCPECGRIFVIEHGRQQYCSTRCSNRARVKRYRLRNVGE